MVKNGRPLMKNLICILLIFIFTPHASAEVQEDRSSIQILFQQLILARTADVQHQTVGQIVKEIYRDPQNRESQLLYIELLNKKHLRELNGREDLNYKAKFDELRNAIYFEAEVDLARLTSQLQQMRKINKDNQNLCLLAASALLIPSLYGLVSRNPSVVISATLIASLTCLLTSLDTNLAYYLIAHPESRSSNPVYNLIRKFYGPVSADLVLFEKSRGVADEIILKNLSLPTI